MYCACRFFGRNQRGLGYRRRLALSFGLNHLIARWIEGGTRDPMMVLAASGLLVWWLHSPAWFLRVGPFLSTR